MILPYIAGAKIQMVGNFFTSDAAMVVNFHVRCMLKTISDAFRLWFPV